MSQEWENKISTPSKISHLKNEIGLRMLSGADFGLWRNINLSWRKNGRKASFFRAVKERFEVVLMGSWR